MQLEAWPSQSIPQSTGNVRSLLLKRLSQTCLPFSLQMAVPNCAIGCIQQFIENNYEDTSCTATSSLNTLCTTKNASGLTIGEGSLQCIVADCNASQDDLVAAYNVCNDIPGALPRQAATITATISSVASTTSGDTSTSQPPVTTSISTSNEEILSATTSTSTQFTGIVSDTAPPPNPTGGRASATSTGISSSTSAALGAGASNSTPTLTTNAIAGIATGAVVAGALILGYWIYWYCIRKKQRDERRFRSIQSSRMGPPKNVPISEITGSLNTNLPPMAVSNSNKYTANEREEQNPKYLFTGNPMEFGINGNKQNPLLPMAPRMGLPARPNANTPPFATPTIRVVDTSLQPTNMPSNRSPSPADSFREDLEAQNQDLPALRSPSWSRSNTASPQLQANGNLSAPLRLNMIGQNNSSQLSQIPMTPTYDNGYYDRSDGQYPGGPMSSVYPPRSASLGYNQLESLSAAAVTPGADMSWDVLEAYSNRQTAYELPTTQPQTLTASVVPAYSSNNVRPYRMSINTDIDEDSTPEVEEDKRLGKRPPLRQIQPRPSVRDIAYPQVPRSASIRKQALRPAQQSPRSTRPPDFLTPAYVSRDQLVQQGNSFLRTNTSSSENTDLPVELPVFPLPPAVTRRQEAYVAEKITQSIQKAAARPYSTNTNRAAPTLQPQPPLPTWMQSSSQYQPQQWNPPAQNAQSQGYYKPMIPPSKASLTPGKSRGGDMYLTVNY